MSTLPSTVAGASYANNETLASLLPRATEILSQDPKDAQRGVYIAAHPYTVPDDDRIHGAFISALATEEAFEHRNSRHLKSQGWITGTDNLASSRPFDQRNLDATQPDATLIFLQEAILEKAMTRLKARASTLTNGSKTYETLMQGPKCDAHSEYLAEAFVQDCGDVIREIDPNNPLLTRLSVASAKSFRSRKPVVTSYRPSPTAGVVSADGMYGKPESCGIGSCSGVFSYDHPPESHEEVVRLRRSLHTGETSFKVFVKVEHTKDRASGSNRLLFPWSMSVVPHHKSGDFDNVYPPASTGAKLLSHLSKDLSNVLAQQSGTITAHNRSDFEDLLRNGVSGIKEDIQRITDWSGIPEHNRFKGLDVKLTSRPYDAFGSLSRSLLGLGKQGSNSHMGHKLASTVSRKG